MNRNFILEVNVGDTDRGGRLDNDWHIAGVYTTQDEAVSAAQVLYPDHTARYLRVVETLNAHKVGDFFVPAQHRIAWIPAPLPRRKRTATK